MNEFVFFFHLFAIIVFGLGALRWGREALCVWVVIQALLANIFVLKQVELFGFHVTASDCYAIGSMFGLNLIQEYFGKDSARKTGWICLYFMLFFIAMSQFHLLYIPSSYDNSHEAFSLILGAAPRLLFASLLSFAIVQACDRKLFGSLRQSIPSLSFFWRNSITSSLSQAIDTILFSIIGLWGLVGRLDHIILVSFAVKLFVILCISPLALFSRKIFPPNQSPELQGPKEDSTHG